MPKKRRNEDATTQHNEKDKRGHEVRMNSSETDNYNSGNRKHVGNTSHLSDTNHDNYYQRFINAIRNKQHVKKSSSHPFNRKIRSVMYSSDRSDELNGNDNEILPEENTDCDNDSAIESPQTFKNTDRNRKDKRKSSTMRPESDSSGESNSSDTEAPLPPSMDNAFARKRNEHSKNRKRKRERNRKISSSSHSNIRHVIVCENRKSHLTDKKRSRSVFSFTSETDDSGDHEFRNPPKKSKRTEPERRENSSHMRNSDSLEEFVSRDTEISSSNYIDNDFAKKRSKTSKNTTRKKIRNRESSESKQDSVSLSSDSDSDIRDIINNEVCKKIKKYYKSKMQTIVEFKKMLMWKCSKCDIHFSKESELRKHACKASKHQQKGKHTVNPKRCEYCSLKFSDNSLREHLKIHYKDGKFQKRLTFNIITQKSYSLSGPSIEISSESSESDGEKNKTGSTLKPRNSEKGVEPTATRKGHKSNGSGTNNQVSSNEPEKHNETVTKSISNSSKGNNNNIQTMHKNSTTINSKDLILYKCECCIQYFITEKTWKTHLKKNYCKNELKKDLKKCVQCNIYFTNATWFTHRKNIHDKYPSITLKDFRIHTGKPSELNTVTVPQHHVVSATARDSDPNIRTNEPSAETSTNQSTGKDTSKVSEPCKIKLAKTTAAKSSSIWKIVPTRLKDTINANQTVLAENENAKVNNNCGNINQDPKSIQHVNEKGVGQVEQIVDRTDTAATNSINSFSSAIVIKPTSIIVSSATENTKDNNDSTKTSRKNAIAAYTKRTLLLYYMCKPRPRSVKLKETEKITNATEKNRDNGDIVNARKSALAGDNAIDADQSGNKNQNPESEYIINEKQSNLDKSSENFIDNPITTVDSTAIDHNKSTDANKYPKGTENLKHAYCGNNIIVNISTPYTNSNYKIQSESLDQSFTVMTADSTTENIAAVEERYNILQTDNQKRQQDATISNSALVENSTVEYSIKKEMIDEQMQNNNCNLEPSIENPLIETVLKEEIKSGSDELGIQLKNEPHKDEITSFNIVTTIENTTVENDDKEIKTEKSLSESEQAIQHDSKSIKTEHFVFDDNQANGRENYNNIKTESCVLKEEQDVKNDYYEEEIKTELAVLENEQTIKYEHNDARNGKNVVLRNEFGNKYDYLEEIKTENLVLLEQNMCVENFKDEIKIENNVTEDNQAIQYEQYVEIKIENYEQNSNLENNNSSLDNIKILDCFSMAFKVEEPNSSSNVEISNKIFNDDSLDAAHLNQNEDSQNTLILIEDEKEDVGPILVQHNAACEQVCNNLSCYYDNAKDGNFSKIDDQNKVLHRKHAGTSHAPNETLLDNDESFIEKNACTLTNYSTPNSIKSNVFDGFLGRECYEENLIIRDKPQIEYEETGRVGARNGESKGETGEDTTINDSNIDEIDIQKEIINEESYDKELTNSQSNYKRVEEVNKDKNPDSDEVGAVNEQFKSKKDEENSQQEIIEEKNNKECMNGQLNSEIDDRDIQQKVIDKENRETGFNNRQSYSKIDKGDFHDEISDSDVVKAANEQFYSNKNEKDVQQGISEEENGEVEATNRQSYSGIDNGAIQQEVIDEENRETGFTNRQSYSKIDESDFHDEISDSDVVKAANEQFYSKKDEKDIQQGISKEENGKVEATNRQSYSGIDNGDIPQEVIDEENREAGFFNGSSNCKIDKGDIQNEITNSDKVKATNEQTYSKKYQDIQEEIIKEKNDEVRATYGQSHSEIAEGDVHDEIPDKEVRATNEQSNSKIYYEDIQKGIIEEKNYEVGATNGQSYSKINEGDIHTEVIDKDNEGKRFTNEQSDCEIDEGDIHIKNTNGIEVTSTNEKSYNKENKEAIERGINAEKNDEIGVTNRQTHSKIGKEDIQKITMDEENNEKVFTNRRNNCKKDEGDIQNEIPGGNELKGTNEQSHNKKNKENIQQEIIDITDDDDELEVTHWELNRDINETDIQHKIIDKNYDEQSNSKIDGKNIKKEIIEIIDDYDAARAMHGQSNSLIDEKDIKQEIIAVIDDDVEAMNGHINKDIKQEIIDITDDGNVGARNRQFKRRLKAVQTISLTDDDSDEDDVVILDPPNRKTT